MGGLNAQVERKTVLLVEDEYLIALNIELAFREAGALVIGPCATVEAATGLLDAGTRPDAAILDINVRETPVFPIAEILKRQQIPFVFATGYDRWAIPPQFVDVPRFEKPTDPAVLIKAVADLLYLPVRPGVS